ncbi:hypothetical protein L1987_21139 [Smallanthus sonchifolius]|uniref:Uncharacterized protein n=1 Tax=Smallanthus sonchifolius TaxID=185202 RepID=A0ACB9IUA3_9ASTR|nr:hypothetical protein L1987_21139 [Smallanthus sonchifolius]
MSDDDRDTVPLHPSSQSDIDEIENLITASVQFSPSTVQPARPPSPTRASIPISASPFIPSNLPPPSSKPAYVPPAPLPPSNANTQSNMSGFGPPVNTLTEPVWETVKRDVSRIVSNLKLVVFPNPYREDPGKALIDWDLWGPFIFISEVFAVAFGLLATGWAYNLLPKSESIGLLFIPSGFGSSNLHVEGQCCGEDGGGVCDIGLKLLGRVSIHKHSGEP